MTRIENGMVLFDLVEKCAVYTAHIGIRIIKIFKLNIESPQIHHDPIHPNNPRSMPSAMFEGICHKKGSTGLPQKRDLLAKLY